MKLPCMLAPSFVHLATESNIELEGFPQLKRSTCLLLSQNHIASALGLCNAPVCLASFSAVKIFALLSYFINF